LKILQGDFNRALHDEEALQLARKAGRLDVNGEEAESMAKSILQVSPEVANLVKGAYGVKQDFLFRATGARFFIETTRCVAGDIESAASLEKPPGRGYAVCLV